MKITYLKNSDYSVSTWSGGETTEFYLSPIQGKYEVGKFDFRVSSASIKHPETEFTPLPGYQRLIMSLDRSVKLTHQSDNFRKVDLKAFESHYFLGESLTKSIGVCTDFNLIYRENLQGEMWAVGQNDQVVIESQSLYVIYLLEEARILYFEENQTKSAQLQPENCIVIDEVTQNIQVRMTSKLNTDKPIAVAVRIYER